MIPGVGKQGESNQAFSVNIGVWGAFAEIVNGGGAGMIRQFEAIGRPVSAGIGQSVRALVLG
ncbi:MAG: hypothetical protein P8L85_21205 [Rubripirellula sp.]|nr:hypothetical protein [Rubripirellula sp.]